MADKLKLLFIICNRKDEKGILDLVSNLGGIMTTSQYCLGTTKSDLLTILGLGETEKNIIITSARDTVIKEIYTVLTDIYRFTEPNQGIAFTVPVSAVGGPATLAVMSGEIINKNGEKKNGKRI